MALLIVSGILALQTDTLETGNKKSGIGLLPGYLKGSLVGTPKQLLNSSKNANKSIHYLLYTPDNSETPCYLESNLEAVERCPFNSSYPMKFLIHGFLSIIHPGGPFLMIKDALLKNYPYNVIVVDWSQYNKFPYTRAAFNTLSVGRDLANLIQFLQKSAAVDVKKIHLIGHSLGAHLSGVVGKSIPNLGRITGLDPAALFFSPHSLPYRLKHSDANFVDVIHSSNHSQGFGEEKPIGDLDFYPNGGKSQPHCQKESKNVISLSERICNHSSALSYFLKSVVSSQCNFLATKCDSFTDFQKGICSNDSSPVAQMGLPAEPIPGLPAKSTFYLRTNQTQSYCLQGDYEPK